MFATVLKWLKNKLVRDDPALWRLELHDAGFRCYARKRCDDIHWSEVRSIRAYERDVFTYDLICLALETNSGECVEIDEQMRGFMAVVKQMEKAFPGIPADWYSAVMLPPFAANERVLWRSGDGGGSTIVQ